MMREACSNRVWERGPEEQRARGRVSGRIPRKKVVISHPVLSFSLSSL
jgi:hypothetical protein